MQDDRLRWYKWDPYKFWADSRIDDLDSDEIGIYRALLDHMWMHPQGKLPDKDNHNARRCRVSEKDYRAAKIAIQQAGLIETDSGWITSPDLDKTRKRAIDSLNHAPKAHAKDS